MRVQPSGLGAQFRVTAASWAAARVYCDNMAAPGFVVRNTSIFAARRWGLLVGAHDGVVEDCHLANTSSQGVMIVNAQG